MHPNVKTLMAALKTVAALRAYAAEMNDAGRAALSSAQETLNAAAAREVADAAIVLCETSMPVQIDPSTLRSYLTRYNGAAQIKGPQ